MKLTSLRIAVLTASIGFLASGLAYGGPAGTLTVGLMPAVNSIPLLVAQADGLFAAHGVKVDLVTFDNQLYRESGLQTHAIDGTISDLVNAVAAVSNGFDVKVTSESEGDFALLTAPNASVRTLGEWKAAKGKIETGSLSDSIVNYVTDAMLKKLSADPGKVDLIPVLSLPTRIEMLLQGRLQAACIPEPYATLARMKGAHLIADTSILSATPGVILFTGKAISEKAALIRAFYQAYNEAAARVDANPKAYRSTIVAEGGFPPQVTNDLPVPHFAKAQLPSKAAVDDVGSWMVAHRMIARAPSYASVTDGRLLN